VLSRLPVSKDPGRHLEVCSDGGNSISFASFLLRIVTGAISPDTIPMLVGIALVVAAAAFALGYIEVFGGADSIAIIIIALTLFYVPVSHSLFVFASSTTTVIVCVLIFVAIFIKNVVERNYRDLSIRQFPLMFVGTKIPFAHFTTYHGIVLEEVTAEDGALSGGLWISRGTSGWSGTGSRPQSPRVNRRTCIDRRRKVWVMYVLPFIIPITAGLAVTLGVGDVVQILLHL
jgi:preflagellin peptidase FlaK